MGPIELQSFFILFFFLLITIVNHTAPSPSYLLQFVLLCTALIRAQNEWSHISGYVWCDWELAASLTSGSRWRAKPSEDAPYGNVPQSSNPIEAVFNGKKWNYILFCISKLLTIMFLNYLQNYKFFYKL